MDDNRSLDHAIQLMDIVENVKPSDYFKSKMNKIERTQKAVQQAIKAIDEVLNDESLLQSKTSSMNQLQEFKANLQEMQQNITTGNLPGQSLPPVKRMGHIVADSWPIGSPIGEAILTAEQEYLELLQGKIR